MQNAKALSHFLYHQLKYECAKVQVTFFYASCIG